MRDFTTLDPSCTAAPPIWLVLSAPHQSKLIYNIIELTVKQQPYWLYARFYQMHYFSVNVMISCNYVAVKTAWNLALGLL